MFLTESKVDIDDFDSDGTESDLTKDEQCDSSEECNEDFDFFSEQCDSSEKCNETKPKNIKKEVIKSSNNTTDESCNKVEGATPLPLDESSLQYKIMRKMQTSNIALKHQMKEQKRYFERRYNACKTRDDYKSLSSWCTKNINSVQKKINGTEIKDKKILNQMKTQLEGFKKQCDSKASNLSESEIKELGLRTAKNINKALQRSDMNSLLKPYFTENTLQYYKDENDNMIFTLNSQAIDNEAMLDEIPDRYGNNIKYLVETIEKSLEKQGLSDVFTLVESSPTNELFEFGNTYKQKYLQCSLKLNESSGDSETSGLAKPTTSDDIPWEERNNQGLKLNINQSDYYKMFEDQGGSTTRELRAEVNLKTPHVISNAWDVKKGNNIFNGSVANSENLYESVDFINNLSDEDKVKVYNLLQSNNLI